MDVIYGLIPGMILLGLVAVGVFFWAAKSGQFDDLEGEANRILMDDDLDSGPPKPSLQEPEENTQADGDPSKPG
ncbi:MAG: cbb3-type cytochrome oxidase assembly protein CcoS [Gammaproteobacteria bacterium]|nr:cbb3-type cytochrome oxidase assembly protein CcoS [Gammaproteobacteria bacterium]